MKRHKKKVFTKIIVWLAAEIILNLMGLDNMADYSEFVFERDIIALNQFDRLTVLKEQ